MKYNISKMTSITIFRWVHFWNKSELVIIWKITSKWHSATSCHWVSFWNKNELMIIWKITSKWHSLTLFLTLVRYCLNDNSYLFSNEFMRMATHASICMLQHESWLITKQHLAPLAVTQSTTCFGSRLNYSVVTSLGYTSYGACLSVFVAI